MLRVLHLNLRNPSNPRFVGPQSRWSTRPDLQSSHIFPTSLWSCHGPPSAVIALPWRPGRSCGPRFNRFTRVHDARSWTFGFIGGLWKRVSQWKQQPYNYYVVVIVGVFYIPNWICQCSPFAILVGPSQPSHWRKASALLGWPHNLDIAQIGSGPPKSLKLDISIHSFVCELRDLFP